MKYTGALSKLSLLVSLLILILVGSVRSADHIRQAWYVAGSIGFAPVAKWSIPGNVYFAPPPPPNWSFGPSTTKETKAGFAFQLQLGHALNGNNLFCYDADLVAYKSPYYNQTIIQGLHNLSWLHFYSPGKTSIFHQVGFGIYTFDGQHIGAGTGLGLLAGLGVEFNHRMRATALWSTGSTELDDTRNLNHMQISLLYGLVIY